MRHVLPGVTENLSLGMSTEQTVRSHPQPARQKVNGRQPKSHLFKGSDIRVQVKEQYVSLSEIRPAIVVGTEEEFD